MSSIRTGEGTGAAMVAWHNLEQGETGGGCLILRVGRLSGDAAADHCPQGEGDEQHLEQLFVFLIRCEEVVAIWSVAGN